MRKQKRLKIVSFALSLIMLLSMTFSIGYAVSPTDEVVFELRKIAVDGSKLTFQLNLLEGGFNSFDIEVEDEVENSLCTKITKGEQLKAFVDELEEAGENGPVYAANKDTGKISLASTATYDKVGELFVIEFECEEGLEYNIDFHVNSLALSYDDAASFEGDGVDDGTVNTLSNVTCLKLAFTQDYEPVERFDPSKQPADTTDPTDPATPTDAEPTEPTNPVDPSNPVDPTNPTDPTDQTEPVNPVDPENPTDTDPVDPANPADPTNPDNPDNPTDPVDPADSTDPVDPADPSDTTDPVNPSNPSEPTDPSTDDKDDKSGSTTDLTKAIQELLNGGNGSGNSSGLLDVIGGFLPTIVSGINTNNNPNATDTNGNDDVISAGDIISVSPSDSENDDVIVAGSPKTGDINPIYIVLASVLVLASATGIAIITYNIKKQKKAENA